MLKISIKTKDVRLFLPVPYVVIHLALTIATITAIQRKIIEALTKHNLLYLLPLLHKPTMRSLLHELKQSKGLTVLDITAQDGTKVIVKL